MTLFHHDFLQRQQDPNDLSEIVRRLRLQANQIGNSVVNVENLNEIGNTIAGIQFSDPNRIVITDDTGSMTTDPSLEYFNGNPDTFLPGEELDRATVAGSSEAGVQITGLTVDQWYAIEGAGGPYHYHPSTPPFNGPYYTFQLSLDGSNWSGQIGYSNTDTAMHLELPNFCVFAEAVGDGNNGRVYWKATTTSVWFRPYDSVWDDNTGSLDYRLLDAIVDEKRIELDGVEYTTTKLGFAINGQDAITTLAAADKIPVWQESSGLGKEIEFSDLETELETDLQAIFDLLYAAISHSHTLTDVDFLPGHLHSLERWNGVSGQTTFDLSEYWEYIDAVMQDGTEIDPLNYALSADSSQIVLTSGLGADATITAHGVIAQL